MDILTIRIKKIHYAEERKRTIKVCIDADTCAGVTKEQVYYFLKVNWSAVKLKMSFLETTPLLEDTAERFEQMPEAEWIKHRYSGKISDFSDEEIADEFNRRLKDGVFHNLSVEVHAVVKERR